MPVARFTRSVFIRVAFAALAATLGLPSASSAAPTTHPAGDDVREGPVILPRGDGVGELVADVAFTDLAGQPGRLADYRGRKATVVCLTGTACPLAKKYGPVLADLERRYRARGVAFLMVNPNANEPPARMAEAFESL